MFNPYEVSSFHEKQRIEKLLCSGDVLRPHKVGEPSEAMPNQATSQQPLAEKKISTVSGVPAPAGAKHKQKYGRKQKKGDTLNLSKNAIIQANTKADEKVKKDDKASSDGERQPLDNSYMIGTNGA